MLKIIKSEVPVDCNNCEYMTIASNNQDTYRFCSGFGNALGSDKYKLSTVEKPFLDDGYKPDWCPIEKGE